MKSLILANIVRYIHYSLIAFILLGNLFIPKRYLKYYIVLIAVVILDWNDIDGMCILTKLEHYFRTNEWASKSPIEGGPEFFRPLLQSLTGIHMTNIEADRLNTFMFVLVMLIAILRILFWK